MGESMKPLGKLLRDAARTSDEEASPRATAQRASQRALEAWEARGARRSPWARGMVALAVAMVAVGLLIASIRSSRDALSYVVGESAEPGKVGAWIASPPEGLPLRFSDGTELSLRAGASARVTRSDAHGADVLLERGALRASVVHRDASTAWTVHAGPYQIHVVGTSFDASWDPSSGALDVRVLEGRVNVTGPLLDDGRAVQSDEHLHVSLKESRFEMTKTPTPYAAATDGPKSSAGSAEPRAAAGGGANAGAGDGAIAAAGGANAAAGGANAAGGAEAVPGATVALTSTAAAASGASGASTAAPRGSASSSSPSGWRDMARAGQHRAALDAAVTQGFDRVLGEASGSDLLLLADSARYAGDSAHAKQALVAARARGEKGRTAFLLGKLAADASGSPGEGAQWFETYLRESPGGALAEQALGRLIELYRRAGQTGSARAAASKYIDKYPTGGYASAARSVLEN